MVTCLMGRELGAGELLGVEDCVAVHLVAEGAVEDVLQPCHTSMQALCLGAHAALRSPSMPVAITVPVAEPGTMYEGHVGPLTIERPDLDGVVHAGGHEPVAIQWVEVLRPRHTVNRGCRHQAVRHCMPGRA